MSDARTLGALLKRVAAGERLDGDAMEAAFATMLSGEADPVQMSAFLTALKVRGETTTEIAAAARAMRNAAIGFTGPDGTVDTCGTGGDGANTVNISTTTAIVLAACGVPVAKHGNKAVSSASGSSDVLTALGVNVAAGPAVAERCLSEIGLAFLFAPNHHPAVRHVAPVRAALGFRTLFNLLGPLTNPAGARRQLLGVYDGSLCVPIAETLASLGAEAAWVVHGADGLDEMSISGPTQVAVLADGIVSERKVVPADAGLKSHPLDALRGGDATENAAACREVLGGKAGAYRDAVLLNTAAGLIIAGRSDDLRSGAQTAANAIDDGRAQAKLEQLIQATAP